MNLSNSILDPSKTPKFNKSSKYSESNGFLSENGSINSSVNNTTNRILTRYNLENPKYLRTLTTNEIAVLKNPNKNSCLVTKLEIVKKICKLKGINNRKFNNNLKRYINELKSLEIPSESVKKNNNMFHLGDPISEQNLKNQINIQKKSLTSLSQPRLNATKHRAVAPFLSKKLQFPKLNESSNNESVSGISGISSNSGNNSNPSLKRKDAAEGVAKAQSSTVASALNPGKRHSMINRVQTQSKNESNSGSNSNNNSNNK